MMKKIAFLLVAALIVSCNTTKNQNETKSEAENMALAGEYSISTMDGKDVKADNLTMTVDAASGAVSGHNGCNRYMAMLNKGEGNSMFKDVARTKKYCPEKEALETSFMTHIANVAKMKSNGASIDLQDASGKTLFVLNR